MVQLILHIGHPKTGTTSLQRTYLRQRKEMAARGVLYPYLNRESDRHSALIPALIAKELVTGDVAFSPHWPGGDVMGQSAHMWHDVLRQMDEVQPHTVVLSGEGFFMLHRTWQMQEMRARLVDLFDKITVVAYLRSPQSRFLSSYQQGLKTAGNQAFLQPRPYMPVIRAWDMHGPGQLDLHVFDRNLMAGGNVVQDFTSRYAPDVLDLIQTDGTRELNSSISAEAMAVMQRHIPLVDHLKNPERRAVWQPVREVMMHLDQTTPGYTRPRLLPEAAEIIQRRSMDIRWMRSDYDITFADVDYDIVSSQDKNRKWRPMVEELCQIDPVRLARMEPAAQAALERARILPTTFLKRARRKLLDQIRNR